MPDNNATDVWHGEENNWMKLGEGKVADMTVNILLKK
jgi:hypothetical protein